MQTMYSTDKYRIFYIVVIVLYFAAAAPAACCLLLGAPTAQETIKNKRTHPETLPRPCYYFITDLRCIDDFCICYIGKSGPILPNRNTTQGVPCSTAPRRSHPSAIT